MKDISRATAVDILAHADLKKLSLAERAERLETILCEEWSDDPEWAALPAALRSELEGEHLSCSPASDRYDPALTITLRHRHTRALNGYLKKCLAEGGHPV